MTAVLIEQALTDFNRGEAFSSHLAPQVVLEFPYGPSLGLPARVVGHAQVCEVLGAAQASGLRLGSAEVSALGPGRFLAEYVGTYRGTDRPCAQVPLIAVIHHDGRSITGIREYWDTLAIAQLAGR